jgi:uncharacterized protein (DUF2235 family)
MPARKRIVVCCDGTWKDADSGDGYTNVSRLAWAILPVDTRKGQEIAQVVFYQSGVGSEGDILGKIKGGSVGLGLSRNVRDAYAFICNNYCDGDEIFLFGFSRGAYTARSVGGLIGYAGLIGKRDLDRFNELWAGYRFRDKVGHEDPLPKFADRHKDARIKCIGVWDTVGSLGVPGNLDKLFQDFYKFHDTDLGEKVDNAFHALALDERRKDFVPALWKQKPAAKANGQVLKQVWFAGAHSDVGGGYPEHGLSDITLFWMASEVADLLAIDFDYLKARRDLSSPWGLGLLHDSADGFWVFRPKITRTVFDPATAAVTNESIHESVAERLNGGDKALPERYAGDALKGIKVAERAGKLSDTEAALRWSAQDVKPAAKQPADDVSLRSKIIDLLGGG